MLPGLPVHGGAPDAPSEHRLRVYGLVREPATFGPADLAALPRADVTDDFICREGWCVPGLHWEGVILATVLDLVAAEPEATHVQVSSGGFSTPIPISDARRALLAMDLGDEPLPREHGGPIRLVLPGADCWTSVKWVDRIEVRRAPGEDTAQATAMARVAQRKAIRA